MEPIKETFIGAQQCFTPPFISTALKAAAAAATAIIVKANQSINSISEDKIRTFLNDQNVRLSLLIKQIRGSCIGNNDMTNVTEETLISNLLCKIISNNTNEQPFLKDNTLSDLAAILNVYSNGEYIAMTKKFYDEEKQNALEAVSQTAIGTDASGAFVDAGLAAFKAAPSQAGKEFKSLMGPQSGKPGAPEDIFAKSIVTAPIAASTAYGMVFLGAEILKSYNTLIPKKFLPDFNILLTAMVERQKRKKNLQEEIDNCIKTETTNFIRDTMGPLLADKGRNRIPYTLPMTNQPVQVARSDFDFNKYTYSSTSSARRIIEPEIKESCRKLKETVQYHIDLADTEIKNIEKVLKEYNSLFQIPEDNMSIKDICEALVPIVNNLQLESITPEKIREIDQKIQQLKSDIESKNILPDSNKVTIGDKFTKTVGAIPGRVTDVFSSLKNTFTSPTGLFKSGGKKFKKTKHVRKNKTQKRRKRSHRRR